jgi:ABC-type amino acid transport substrate-binding protein
MMNASAAVLGCVMLLAGSAWAGDSVPLTVCLQANDPPLSLRGDGSGGGFDVMLARTIAERLGRDLHVQWFVSKDDPDTNLVKDTNALLSDGRCQVMAEYPMLNSTLRQPYAQSAKLPPFDGATPDDRRRWVKTNDVLPTRPYRSDAMAVVLTHRVGNRRVQRLADLDGMRIGVQIATLSDAIAMRYGSGLLMEHVVHMTDAREVFDGLQDGKIDAAFANLHAFDAWRVRHGSSALAPSGYVHSLAFNMGFVGLATNETLIRQVDSVLADLQAEDAIAPMAARAGLTFLPPRSPAVQPEIRPDALIGD